MPNLLPGSPSSGHRGAAQAALRTWHRSRELQSWGPDMLWQLWCSPSQSSPTSCPEPGVKEHRAAQLLSPVLRDQSRVTRTKSRAETENREWVA